MAYDQRLADVEAQLAERTRELEQVRAAIAQEVELACQPMLAKLDSIDGRVEKLITERDAARAATGEAVKRLGETRGQLVMAEDEVRRLRDSVSSIEVLTDLPPPTYTGLSDRLASIRKCARQALGKPSGATDS